MKKKYYIPISLVIGLLFFISWFMNNPKLDHGESLTIYESNKSANNEEARGVKKSKQEEFKSLSPSEAIIPIGENN